MRVWLNQTRLTNFGLTSKDVIAAATLGIFLIPMLYVIFQLDADADADAGAGRWCFAHRTAADGCSFRTTPKELIDQLLLNL